MQIRVRGSYEAEYRPERGTVHIVMALEGPHKADVVRSTTALIARMTERVRAEHAPDSGPITWYSQGELQNSAHRPWNQEGKQLPLVYTSRADMKVKFSALDRLFPFIEEISGWDGVSVRGVEWALTEASKREATNRAQGEAVRSARAKAERYAAAAGYPTIRPVAIADVGLLVDSNHGGPALASPARMRAPGAAGGESGQTFAPEDIRVECAVDAEFVTADG